MSVFLERISETYKVKEEFCTDIAGLCEKLRYLKFQLSPFVSEEELNFDGYITFTDTHGFKLVENRDLLSEVTDFSIYRNKFKLVENRCDNSDKDPYSLFDSKISFSVQRLVNELASGNFNNLIVLRGHIDGIKEKIIYGVIGEDFYAGSFMNERSSFIGDREEYGSTSLVKVGDYELCVDFDFDDIKDHKKMNCLLKSLVDYAVTNHNSNITYVDYPVVALHRILKNILDEDNIVDSELY